MKRNKIFITLLFASGLAASFATNANRSVVAAGYASPACSTLRNIDGGFTNCAVQAGTQCQIDGQNAYDSPTNCAAGGASGLLKRP